MPTDTNQSARNWSRNAVAELTRAINEIVDGAAFLPEYNDMFLARINAARVSAAKADEALMHVKVMLEASTDAD